MTEYTPAQAAAALSALDARIIPDQVIALRGALRSVRSRIAGAFATRGIGRTLRRQGKETDGLIHDPVIAHQSPSSATAEIELVGLAAIQEEGGRTRAHQIPRSPHLLSFSAFGRRIVVPEVDHPGSNVRARPFAEPVVLRAEPDLVRNAQLAADATVARFG